MDAIFKSAQQEKLFDKLFSELKALGYRKELLARSYPFIDWFQPDTPQRQAPAAAFGRIPLAYDSACIAILLANGKHGVDLVNDFRALGAPFAFEVREDAIIQWRVGKDANTTVEQLHISPSAVERVFHKHKNNWSSQNILRLKNINFQHGPRQLDLIDLGLIPALEREIYQKLDVLLNEVIAEAVTIHKRNTSQEPDEQELFHLVFRFLAAKVLHDRGVPPFNTFSRFPDARKILKEVSHYYGEERPVPQDVETQEAVASNLWSSVDFRNLSVEVLAYIYENTLVDEKTRKEKSIHSTPYSIARYIVHHLPFKELGEHEQRVVEPFAGYGILLISALQRLRNLLPSGIDPATQHHYFVKSLQGFELDPFALEVSKLCLMLADFPNRNGWQLHKEDVFNSQKFISAIQKANIVLCNPPFEKFLPAERRQYTDLRSPYKSVELLYRVLDHLPARGMLGVVLPRQFIDGKSYREIRERLAERFEEIEVVALPDKVFRESSHRTALLITKSPRSKKNASINIVYTEVADQHRTRFLTQYDPTRRDQEVKSIAAAKESVAVLAFRETWLRLSNLPQLINEADIHRGVEWEQPFKEDQYLSVTPKDGFRLGLPKAEGNLLCFQAPSPIYLSALPEHRRKLAPGGFNLPWDKPKVIMNAAMVARGFWCIAAFADDAALMCSQSFYGIWPKGHWSTKALAAVLNGPVACAFVAAHKGDQLHIRKKTLQRIPLPQLDSSEIRRIDLTVDQYLQAVTSSTARVLDDPDFDQARRLLLEIDALVLKGYHLQPRLERELLDYFRGATRHVPFVFEEYFPETFTPTIPLWMYISPDYWKCTAANFRSMAPKITDPRLIEALREVE